MAPKNSPKTITKNIIQFILSKSVVHYQDLMEYTGLSRKTVAKYLKQVEQFVQQYGVQLVRKKGYGIYFTGSTKDLLNLFPPMNHNNDAVERQVNLVSFLVKAQQPVLLDDLAAHFFVSRSTLERDLSYLKQNYHLQFSTSQQGIMLNNSEAELRHFQTQIIQMYWGEEIKQNQRTGRLTRNFQVPPALSQLVDKEILDRTQKVLNQFLQKLPGNISEYQYESLLIHLALAIQKIQSQTSPPPPQSVASFEISTNTKHLVDLVEQEFHCQLSSVEISNLNVHIVAIEEGYLPNPASENSNQELVTWLQQVLVNYDDLLIQNLILHLQPALVRIKNGIKIDNPYRHQVKVNFPQAFDQALTLADAIFQKYQVRFPEDEVAYLCLHLESFRERQQKELREVSVAIVCSTGYGTAELIRQKIQDKLPKLNVIGTLSVTELLRKPVSADIILTTIPLKLQTKQVVIQVSPLLNQQELQLLRQLSQKIWHDKYLKATFLDLVAKPAIIVDSTVSSPKAAIQEITQALVTNHYVKDTMQESAWEREQLASTALGTYAIPHGAAEHVLKPVIGILTSQKGILWGKETVYVVFFMAFNDTVKDSLDDIYDYFYDLTQNAKQMKQLRNAQDVETVLKCLQHSTEIKEG